MTIGFKIGQILRIGGVIRVMTENVPFTRKMEKTSSVNIPDDK
jgi:hypothetical protein